MHLKKITSVVLSVMLTAMAFPLSAANAADLVDSGMDYTESTETINNPGAGYTSTLWYTCKPGETQVKNPSGNLVLMFVDIGAFSSGVNGTTDSEGNYVEGVDYDLDDTFFAALRGTLENCRKNGSTVALRFRYDANGKTYPEPASFEQVLHHIDQIKQDGMLEDYKDILMFVESGFVGAWGEQHSGKYTSLEYKAELLDAVLDLVPDDIPVTVRTPNIFAKWAGIETSAMADWVSEPGSQAARVGLYNDGYMGSDSDLGTYSNRAVETAWLGNQTTATYYGGEFSGNLEWTKKYDTYLPENAIPEMYATHLSYINSNIYSLYKDYTFGAQYDVANVDNSAYYGETVFKFMRDHLGYRFTVRDCDLSASCEQGGSFDMVFSVENSGFANPIRPQKAELLLEKDGNYIVTEADIDSRSWLSCTTSEESLSAKVPGGLEAGEWNVYLRLSVGEQEVQDGYLRTVQFANSGVWNSSLGANKMGTIQITETSDVTKKTDQRFSVNGADAENANLYTTNNAVIPDGQRGDTEWTDDSLTAENGDNKLWITNDEQYLYVAADINHNAASPVVNIRIQNADTDKSYWYYRQNNGFIYYSQGSHDGISLQRNGNFIEFKIAFSAMDIQPGTLLSSVRIFIQDEANGWENMGDVAAENYTVIPKCPIYSAYQEVCLSEGQNYTMKAVAAAENAQYTWLHDGEEIGTGQSLTVQNVTSADEGMYSVRIVTANGTEQVNDICKVVKVYPKSASDILVGDLNLDGLVNSADVVLFQNYLLGRDVTIAGDADLNGDGVWDIFDMALLKRLAQ